MREILFRGKRMHADGWVYGNLSFCNEFVSIWSDEIKDDVEVYKDSVGQFTGLYDKNGKRIFEGDIIEATSKHDSRYLRRFEVKYGNCGGAEQTNYNFGYIGFYFLETPLANPDEYRLRTDILYWISQYECEVIGNIHDNPDLLTNNFQTVS